MKKHIVILAAALAMPCLTQASITTEANGNITAIYGSGNSDTWDQVVTYSGNDGNFQLGLNTHINPNNGNQNVDFSINVDPAGLGTTLLGSSYTYWMVVNGVDVSLTSIFFADNSYGNNSTANSQGHETGAQVGDTIFQNSDPLSYWAIATAGVPPTSFTLEVRDANGGILAQDQLNIGTAAVPEPSTYAAAGLMLLPLGAALLRTIRRKQFAVEKSNG